MGHVFGFDQGVEFFGGEEAEFDGGFTETGLFVVSGLGDLGGIVVANSGSEGSDQHQGILHVVVDGLAIQFDADARSDRRNCCKRRRGVRRSAR